MSKGSKKAQGKIVESGKLRMLRKVIRKAKGFLSQRYVWLSLTAGFLWMLSAPFIITLFQGFLGDFLKTFTWIFQAAFFPLTFSSLIFTDVTAPEVWIVIYGFSFVISMLFCLGIAYIIHRIRTRIKSHVT